MRYVEFRSVFRAPSRKFKILAVPNVLAHGKSYEYGFMKKHDGRKLCTKSCASRVSIRFSRTISEIPKPGHSQPEFQSVFRAPSPKFKILAIPNVLAHGKLYEHGFLKKHDGHKLYTKSHVKSSFVRFFVHHLRNSEYW
ncbi:hypothetical protein BHM03_00029256 [Ensete ventricosum]|nr:hypothetical protein BHM03_00029256 [Ensete ventricosum]